MLLNQPTLLKKAQAFVTKCQARKCLSWLVVFVLSGHPALAILNSHFRQILLHKTVIAPCFVYISRQSFHNISAKVSPSKEQSINFSSSKQGLDFQYQNENDQEYTVKNPALKSLGRWNEEGMGGS